MQTIDRVESRGTRAGLVRHRAIIATFAVTLFTSAFLLFLIQPLITKMILPLLGGSPAVWSLALVFFQGVLLLGYAYSHALVTRLAPRVGVPMHLGVLALAMISLPISLPAGWQEAPASGQQLWLIGLLGLSVGLPFFAVSSNAPLLQSWFARTDHPHSSDPYFLYGASNCGSFAALILYPLVVEPLLPLGSQTSFWGIIYALLAAMIAACGFIAWRYGAGSDRSPAAAADESAPAPTLSDRAIWAGLAFVPSGLLVGVTAYITTDLVAAPFLWVIPLALFLLTFVITFQKKPWLSHKFMLWIHSLVVAPLCVLMFTPALWAWLLPAHLAAFFVSTMVCHGELVRRRPPAQYLTEFYLFMSFGGVCGGLFASLIAPQIFSRVFEYPILMLTVFACRADFWEALRGEGRKQALSFALVPAVVAAMAFSAGAGGGAGLSLLIWSVLGSMVALALMHNRPLLQSGILAAALTLAISLGANQNAIQRIRSFFGVSTVFAMEGGRYHVLTHGTTMHGAQTWTDENGVRLSGEPGKLSYFFEGGPYDIAVKLIRQTDGKLEDVAVVGLGAGALACYREQGELWRFFEIDPEVIRIARNPRLFTFMSECAPGSSVVLGDGRLSIKKERDASFDLIIIDAFSSDSVPAHLMTVEAMKLYFSKLKPGGALLFNISNRYMELASVIRAVAHANGAVAYFDRLGDATWTSNRKKYEVVPLIAAVAKTGADLGGIPADPRWYEKGDERMITPWTDDYANFIGAIWRYIRNGGLERRVIAHGE
jgi:hypothetical protein